MPRRYSHDSLNGREVIVVMCWHNFLKIGLFQSSVPTLRVVEKDAHYKLSLQRPSITNYLRWVSRETVGTWYRGSFLYCRGVIPEKLSPQVSPGSMLEYREDIFYSSDFFPQCSLGKTNYLPNKKKERGKEYIKGPAHFLYVFGTER